MQNFVDHWLWLPLSSWSNLFSSINSPENIHFLLVSDERAEALYEDKFIVKESSQ